MWLSKRVCVCLAVCEGGWELVEVVGMHDKGHKASCQSQSQVSLSQCSWQLQAFAAKTKGTSITTWTFRFNDLNLDRWQAPENMPGALSTGMAGVPKRTHPTYETC